MGKGTGIQWCDDTVNPTTGCDGCELWKWFEALGRFSGSCYAGALHEGRLALAMPALYAPNFTEIRLAPGRMAKAAAARDLSGMERPDKPWLNGMPRVIFVGDMGDIFSKDVSFDYLRDELIGNVTSTHGRRHIWMLLTKQPARMAKFAELLKQEHGINWPSNLWAGTSITSTVTLSRVSHLIRVPAETLFLSIEPQLERIDRMDFYNAVRPWKKTTTTAHGHERQRPPIRLVIFGGESQQGPQEARPFDLENLRELMLAAKQAGINRFVKQLGAEPALSVRVSPPASGNIIAWENLGLSDSHGGDWSEWPEDLRVREFPGASVTAAAEDATGGER
jgi:protein gp37